MTESSQGSVYDEIMKDPDTLEYLLEDYVACKADLHRKIRALQKEADGEMRKMGQRLKRLVAEAKAEKRKGK